MSVYDFQWVTSDNFDVKKLSIDQDFIAKTKRKKILYKYNSKEEPKELRLTVPRIERAYVQVNQLKQDSYEGKQTKKYTTSMILDTENKHHVALYDSIVDIVNGATEILELETNMAHKDRDKRIEIYCGVVQTGEGEVHTKFYDSEQILDILEYGAFIGRPALCFSVNTDNGKIQCQIYQAFASKQIKNFPLSIRD